MLCQFRLALRANFLAIEQQSLDFLPVSFQQRRVFGVGFEQIGNASPEGLLNFEQNG